MRILSKLGLSGARDPEERRTENSEPGWAAFGGLDGVSVCGSTRKGTFNHAKEQ